MDDCDAYSTASLDLFLPSDTSLVLKRSSFNWRILMSFSYFLLTFLLVESKVILFIVQCLTIFLMSGSILILLFQVSLLVFLFTTNMNLFLTPNKSKKFKTALDSIEAFSFD